MPLKCNCFTEAQDMLREKTNSPDGVLTKTPGFPLFGDSPYFEFVYNKRKKDGTFEKKKSDVTVVLNYCPFCGQSYRTTTPKQESEKK